MSEKRCLNGTACQMQDKKRCLHACAVRMQAPAGAQGLPYGIIDPDYARVFTIARCLAWAEGYALAMHGSFTRDLDLIAIPWADRCCEPEHLVRRIEAAADLKNISTKPGVKNHGRLAWTLLFKAFGDPRFVDLSILPLPASPSPIAPTPTKEIP